MLECRFFCAYEVKRRGPAEPRDSGAVPPLPLGPKVAENIEVVLASISKSPLPVGAFVAACRRLDGTGLKPDPLAQLLSNGKVPLDQDIEAFAVAIEQRGLAGVLQQVGEKRVAHQYVAHTVAYPDLLPCIKALVFQNTFDGSMHDAEVRCPAPRHNQLP